MAHIIGFCDFHFQTNLENFILKMKYEIKKFIILKIKKLSLFEDMAKLADATYSKFVGCKTVRVQVPLSSIL